MERRGEIVAVENVDDGVAGFVVERAPEVELAVPFDFVGDAEATVKVHEGGAAPDEDMLAVVEDFLGGGVDEAGGAAAEFFTGFDKGDAAATLGESDGGGDACEAATEDGDGGRVGGDGGHGVAVS